MKTRLNCQINENSIVKVKIQLMALPLHNNPENRPANSSTTIERRQHITSTYLFSSTIKIL